MKKCYLPVVMIVTACSSDHHVQPVDASVDTPPIDADETGPNIVTVTNDSDMPPLFLAYRDGARPWQSLDPNATTLHVHDDYELLAVCGDTLDGFETGIQASTFSVDGPSVAMPCFQFVPDDITTVTATGTMVQPGSVSIDLTKTSKTANWPFSITVAKGMHTLLAMGGGKAIVQRALDLEADTTLPTVDTSAGNALVSLAFTLTNAASGATTETRLTEFIGGDFMFLPIAQGSAAGVVPPSLLDANDSQGVGVFALTGTSFQSANESVDANTVTAIDFIPPLTGVTFVAGKVDWSSTLPDGDLELWAFSTTDSNFMHLTPTASSVGSKTELVMDTSVVPGYRPEWVTDVSPPALAFDVLRTDGGVSLDTETFEPLSVAPQRAKALHRRHRGSSLRR